MPNKSVRTEPFAITNVILSHPHLYVAKPYMQNGVPQGKPYFSAVLLVDEATKDLINQQAIALAQRAYPNGEFNHESFGWPVTPANTKSTYATNPRTASLFRVNSKAGESYPPQIVGPPPAYDPVMDRGQMYAGVICAAYINLYSRPQPARPGEVGQGLGVGLKMIAKMSDGEPLAGDIVDPNEAFKGIPVPAPAAVPSSFPGGAPAPAAPGNPFQTAPAAPAPAFGMPMPPFMQS